MNILFFGPSASLGTGYGLLIRNIGSRLNKLGKKKVKCNDCKREDYLEPSKNKCEKCNSKNIEVIEEADKSYNGPYHNVFQMGLHTIGEIDERYGFPILPVGDNPYGSDRLEYYITEYGIDILITMTDLFQDTFSYIKDVVRQTGVYWINHCTIYSTPLSPFVAKSLTHSDLIVAPSNFAYQTIKKGNYDNIKMIYHGVDLNVFKPNPKGMIQHRKESKTEDKFIFLYIARNTPLQKEFPTLFHAYKLFLEMKEVKCKCGYEFESNEPNIKCTKCGSEELTITNNRRKNTILFCHTNPQEIQGFNLQLMAERFGIIKNVLFTAGHNANFTLPPEEMANIYNYADCILVCSTGESFSFILIEGMACGKPVIAMNFSAPVELIKNSGAGLLADIKGMWTTKLISDLCLVDELSYAQCMDKIYSDEKLRERLSKNALNFVKNFDWKIIVKEWERLLE